MVSVPKKFGIGFEKFCYREIINIGLVKFWYRKNIGIGIGKKLEFNDNDLGRQLETLCVGLGITAIVFGVNKFIGSGRRAVEMNEYCWAKAEV